MALTLFPLSVSRLTYEEFAELPGRLKDDIDKNIDKAKLTDITLVDYLDEIYTKGTAFQKGLGKGGTNDFTIKILAGDQARDKAYSIFMKALGLAADSDDVAEVEAATSILNILEPFGNVQQKNYEAESAAIDSILKKLAEPKYEAHITKLGFSKYVTKIQTTNDAFQALFTNRVSDELSIPDFDLKLAKKELTVIYNDAMEYILAMAKSKKNPNVDFFKQLLTVVNAGRKYFSDNYISRGGGKKG